MQKEIVDIGDGIMRITTLDERWYAKLIESTKTKLPEYLFFPSSTWIASYYPKTRAFMQWVAGNGYDESEVIKKLAGDRGSKIHMACEVIDEGKEINAEKDTFPSRISNKEEPLSPDEIECINQYAELVDEAKPELLINEMTVFGKDYAGTLDKIWRIKEEITIDSRCKIAAGVYIVDIKTSQSIWPAHRIQISSYSHADIDYKALGITDKEWEKRRLAVLQLGYRKNRYGRKFTEISDQYPLFRHVRGIWASENPEAKPKQRDLPVRVKSKMRTAERIAREKVEDKTTKELKQ